MKMKVLRTKGPESGFRFPKLTKNWKINSYVTIHSHDVIVSFFLCFHAFFVRFSNWSKFHVNIITGSRVMTIVVYKGLTRNPYIGNTPI